MSLFAEVCEEFKADNPQHCYDPNLWDTLQLAVMFGAHKDAKTVAALAKALDMDQDDLQQVCDALERKMIEMEAA